MRIYYLASLFISGLFVGNYLGDQTTFRACAATGSALMFGGGKVNCEVVKGWK